jgi:hypothetical protein
MPPVTAKRRTTVSAAVCAYPGSDNAELNLWRHLDYVDEAASSADPLVLPEVSINGYPAVWGADPARLRQQRYRKVHSGFVEKAYLLERRGRLSGRRDRLGPAGTGQVGRRCRNALIGPRDTARQFPLGAVLELRGQPGIRGVPRARRPSSTCSAGSSLPRNRARPSRSPR